MSETQYLTEEVATVDRDDEGSILPEDIPIEYNGDEYVAQVRALATGEREKYKRLGADFEQMNSTAIGVLFDNHVETPDIDDADDVRFGIAVQIIQGILQTSGLPHGSDLRDQLEDRIEEAQAEGN